MSLKIKNLMEMPLPEHDLTWLRSALQAALELELSTLPPYLCGLYTLGDTPSDAADLIRSIVFDEMSHFGLAANLLLAAGGQPAVVTGFDQIVYPGPLPGGVRPQCDQTLRFPCKPDFEVVLGFNAFKDFVEMCMQIEYPETPVPRPPSALEAVVETFPTIGQFYAAVLKAFEDLGAQIKYDTTKQVVNAFPNVFLIDGLEAATKAIRRIQMEGEGGDKFPFVGPIPQPPAMPVLSHFYKFGEIYFGKSYVFDAEAQTGDWTGDPILVPDAIPMTPVPAGGYAPGAPDGVLACDQAFSKMLQSLDEAWNGRPDSLNDAIGFMIELKFAAIDLLGKAIARPEGGVYGPQFRKVPISAPPANVEPDVPAVVSVTRYQRVVEILDQAIGGPMANIHAHGTFWRNITRDQFVTKSVLGLALITLGDGAGSNLVKALKGESPFGSDLPVAPDGATKRRMPAGRPPVADADIAFIQTWIDDNCPEDPFVPAV